MAYSLVALAVLAMASSAALASPGFVYVSNADSGNITAYLLDKTLRQLEPIGSYPSGPLTMASVVSIDKKTLYVSVASTPFRIEAWHIHGDGTLSDPQITPVMAPMSYLSLDKSGHFLLGASNNDDLFAVLRLRENGSLAPHPIDVVHTGKRPSSIQTDPANRFLYVTLLGADQLLEYRFDSSTGHVTPNDPSFINIEAESDAGPGHFVFAPVLDRGHQQNLYVLTEEAGTVDRLTEASDGIASAHEVTASVDPDTADRMQRGDVRGVRDDNDVWPSALPRIWQGDIHITSDDRFLYISDRTSNELSSFSIDPLDGSLHYLKSIQTEAQPRSFAIDDNSRFLISTGQRSTSISLYSIDPSTGLLTLDAKAPTGENAYWISVLE